MSVLEAEPPTRPRDHDKFHRLVERAQKQRPVKAAVAHPCDEASLQSAVEAARLRLVQPILVGPEQRIRAAAAEHRLDISSFEIVESKPYAEATPSIPAVFWEKIWSLAVSSRSTEP